MKLPFLHNVRRGLATNSSSSHSLVFHADVATSDNIEDAKYMDTEFGWGHFVLNTLGEKLMYALTARISSRWSNSGNVPDDEEIDAAKREYGDLFPEFDSDQYWLTAMVGYVDHQSIDVASNLDEVRDPHVVIYGGNDNSDYDDWPVLGPGDKVL